jgi:hypothetical protein
MVVSVVLLGGMSSVTCAVVVAVVALKLVVAVAVAVAVIAVVVTGGRVVLVAVMADMRVDDNMLMLQVSDIIDLDRYRRWRLPITSTASVISPGVRCR